MRKSRVFSLLLALMMLFSMMGIQTVFAEPVETSSEPYHLLVSQNMTMTDTKEDWDMTFTVKGPNGEDSVKLSPDRKLDNSQWLLLGNLVGKFSKKREQI